MSSPSRTPLPHLPLEVKGHVLRLSDQATLAVTSRVSLAFLELSIPILHEDIYIRDFDSLEQLLCSRHTHPPSAIDGLLSLDHAKRFTIASTDFDEGPPTFSLHRLVNRRPLVVGQLVLGICDYDPETANSRWAGLFLLFDPERVRIYGASEPPYARVRLDPAPWSNLRSIEFSACTSTIYLGSADFFRQWTIGHLIPLTVIYDFIERGWDEDLWSRLLMDVGHLEPGLDMFGPASRLAEVIVRVTTEDEREKAIQMQTACFEDVPEPEQARRLALIRYEIVNATSVPDATAT